MRTTDCLTAEWAQLRGGEISSNLKVLNVELQILQVSFRRHPGRGRAAASRSRNHRATRRRYHQDEYDGTVDSPDDRTHGVGQLSRLGSDDQMTDRWIDSARS